MAQTKKLLPLGFVVVLLLISMAAAAGRFSVAGVDKDEEVVDYFNTIKKYILEERREELADEILFPIEVYVQNKKTIIKNEKSFLNLYDDVINKKIKCAIKTQKEEDLFATWQGISTSGGEIWFSLVENEKTKEWNFIILSINNK